MLRSIVSRWECERLKTCFDFIIVILDTCLYSNEDREKRYVLGWVGWWGEVGGSETIIRIYCLKKM